MVAEGFVGRGGEVEVVPDETAVVGTDDEVVFVFSAQRGGLGSAVAMAQCRREGGGAEELTSERVNIER